MNNRFPDSLNSPEDRLLDELLREQARGPDEAFLQQLEAAIDAGPSQVAKRPQPKRYRHISIAAGLAVAACGGWWLNRGPEPPALATMEAPSLGLSSEREEIVPGGIGKVTKIDAAVARAVAMEPDRKLDESTPIPKLPQLADIADPLSSERGLSASPHGSGAGSGEGSGGGHGPSREVWVQPTLASNVAPSLPRQRIVPRTNEETLRRILDRPMPENKIVPPPPETASGDRYGSFIDQPWKTPARDPLSTFSIDVDTASYGNVRRMIREGREIPKDAVRIEEFINAFGYHYDPPQGDSPFSVDAALASCPWAPGHSLVRVAIKGREIDAKQRPACNLVFLIDVSGSMQSPDKLPLLKQSIVTMVGQLDERDRVAIVVYAGSEGVALPSTRLDEEGRAKVLKTIGTLEAGGSTNGGAGIERAYELAKEHKVEGGVNRVILATDGDFNVGVTGQESLVELVKGRAQGGIHLTVAGFGTGNLNDAMMDAITRDGNGNYFYIDSEREGRKVFLQNLAGTLVTIAKDVKIQVEFNPAKVGGYRLIGYANRVLKNEDFNNDKVDAGDIGAGHTVTAFYELTPSGETPGTEGLKYQTPPDQPSAAGEWLTVKLRYKHPQGDVSSKIELPLNGEAMAIDKSSTDFRFATAVALTGMKLRDMAEVKTVGWDQVIALATPGLAGDVTEDRAEFVELVKKLRGEGGTTEAAANDDETNVRVVSHENGSKSVIVRSPDHKTLTRQLVSSNGELTLIFIYKIDDKGNPLGCRIFDGRNQELFRVSYGYHKTSGQLVEELIFDSRVKRTQPATAKELPLQRSVYLYDANGERSAPMVFHLVPGASPEDTLGLKSTLLESNPFKEAEH